MTTRHRGYVVVLERDIREDDAEAVINALKMVRGVIDVKPVESNIDAEISGVRARTEVRQKIYNVLKEL